MFLTTTVAAPVREREGLRSRVLLQEGDAPGAALAVTWVDLEPGARQPPHEHPPQQVYVIVRGSGRMLVGDEQRDVAPGDLVFVPPHARHGIANTGATPLSYVSAATPSFSVTRLYDASPDAAR